MCHGIKQRIFQKRKINGRKIFFKCSVSLVIRDMHIILSFRLTPIKMGKEKLQQALTWTCWILNSSSLLVERQSSPATMEIDIEDAQKAWDRSVTRSSCTPLSYITKSLYPLYRDFCSPIYTAAYSHQWGNGSSLDVHHMVNGSWESGIFTQQNIVWKNSVLTFPGSEGTETPKGKLHRLSRI